MVNRLRRVPRRTSDSVGYNASVQWAPDDVQSVWSAPSPDPGMNPSGPGMAPEESVTQIRYGMA